MDEFVVEPRLADAGVADYGGHLTEASNGPLQRRIQHIHLVLAADETGEAGRRRGLQARAPLGGAD